jgi:hypothetical protein
MKKIIIVLILISAAIVLASCTNNTSQVSVTSLPADTPAQLSPSASAAEPSPEETPQPSPADTPQPSSEDTPQHLIKEDIPAYLTAGLQKLSEMPPEWARFYYLSYYDTVEAYSVPDTFNEKTSADLDGDGKEETITIIGGKPYDGSADVDPSFSDITIDIDGNKLKLKSETVSQVALPFTLEGRILDVDNSDGKKEILIESSIEIGPALDYIITYDDKTPRTIFKGELENRYYLFGLGYITIPKDYDTANQESIYYYELLKLKSDRSGFEPAGNKYYPTLHQYFCWENDGNWDESMAAPTKWDQDLYKEPGGGKKVSVKVGTPVFIGLYAKEGWLMILDAKGELLGWLDTNKVNYNEYTNSAFEPEGD